MSHFPRHLTALALACLALLAVPAAASAVVEPVTPRDGLATTSSRPIFTWKLTPGSVPTQLQIAATTTPGGTSLEGAAIEKRLTPAQVRYQPALQHQLYSGLWYWRVIGTTDAGAPAATAFRSFVIRKRVLAPTLRVANTQTGTTGSVRINTNIRDSRVNVKIKQGQAWCLNQSFTARRPRAILHRWSAYRFFCNPRIPIDPGTVVATVVTIRSGDIVRRVVHRSTVR
ncbi:MAG: hypothetical protein JWM90_135 [Thermoleophilia bacterium]|nr:hypothetical protein [Thermoleophilia bacterium]